MRDIIKEISERINNNLFGIGNNYLNELREITQEFLLAGLSETKFFENNVFNGGTALRILYGLNRYSDDLDFNMIINDDKFKWETYTKQLEEYGKKYGINFDFYEDNSDKGWKTKIVRVKDNSITEMLAKRRIVDKNITKKKGGFYPKTKIKIETSCFNNINDRDYELKTLHFPEEKTVKVFNINSLFSGKLCACLTRSEDIENSEERKLVDVGRDWYDLIWYIKKEIEPNYDLLKKKLIVHNIYKNKNIEKNTEWVKKELFERIKLLNYDKINIDVKTLLKYGDNILINEDLLLESIRTMGKDGYKIKDTAENECR